MSEKFKLSDFEPIIREVVESGGEFTMKTNGTSMLPMLSDGHDSVVLVKPTKTIECGDVVFYKRPGCQYVLHRVVGERRDGYVLRGDNQIINEYGVARDSIIAVMTAYIKDGKRIDAFDEDYKKYVNSLERRYRIRCALAFAARIKKKLLSLFGRSQRIDNDK